jgi:predicted AAA+ superfamily ATPase
VSQLGSEGTPRASPAILTRREIAEPKGEAFGKEFEHFIHMELRAHRSYSELEYDIQFWRTKSGLQVDFILGSGRVGGRDLHALNAFVEEFEPKHALVICTEKEERVIGKIRVVPWKVFLTRLWAGDCPG